MKQLLGLFVLVALTLGFAPGAFADENGTNSTNETYVKPMQTGIGAEMRLLQLEKQLVRAQLHGEQVIARLEAQNVSTGNLSRIVAEFEAMIVEVQEARANLNSSGNTENAVQVFVALVHDARALTKEFREETRMLLRDADRRQLRADFERIDREQLRDFDERIKNARNAFNADVAKKALERAGARFNGDFEMRVKAGMSAAMLRDEMKTRIGELDVEKRAEAVAKLTEEKARDRVTALARIEQAQKDIKNVDERYEARMKLAEDKGLSIAKERVLYGDVNKERVVLEEKKQSTVMESAEKRVMEERKYDEK